MKYNLIQGDCLDVLKTLDSQSVNCCVTSPPYYGLRDYGTAKWQGGDENCDHKHYLGGHGDKSSLQVNSTGTQQYQYTNVCKKCGAIRIDDQIGLEQTPEEYVSKLVDVFREVKRVLRDDGTLWLNLGDSYGGSGMGLSYAGFTRGPNAIDSRPLDMRPATGHKRGKMDKQLLGMPWRVAFALQADGWYLRSDIIWMKPNPMPESVKDRPTKSHEYIFLLSKNSKYYYDYKAILEPAKYDGRKDTKYKGGDKDMNCGAHERWPNKIRGFKEKDNGNNPQHHGQDIVSSVPGRNKRTVWTVNTKPFKGAHFAVFPPKLITPCVLAGCPKDGTVLDPFNGAGTTGMVAVKYGRNYIGIDLNPEYIEMSRERIEKANQQMSLFV